MKIEEYVPILWPITRAREISLSVSASSKYPPTRKIEAIGIIATIDVFRDLISV
jgi:hypothetical protein